MNRLLLGPVCNGNRERVIGECRRLVAEGRSEQFLYIAATKPLLDLVTEHLLDGDPRGVLGRLNVFLLSGFCRWIVSEARDDDGLPLVPRARIDTPERPLAPALVARLVAEFGARGELGAFGDLQPSAGVVSSIVALLGEIQRAGLGAAEFADGLRAARASRARGGAVEPDAFDDAVHRIYEAYERVQDTAHLTDGCRDYLLARDMLSGESLDRGVSERVTVPALDRVRLLVVDGFFDVLPVHLSILKLLVARVPDATILLNEDPDNPRAFSAFGEHIETFLSKQWAFEAERTPSTVTRAGALDRIPRYLFSDEEPPPAACDAASCGAESVEAPDRESEVRFVAKRIKRLVAERGYRPDEIAVVSRDGSRYDPLVVEVFGDEGVASTAPDDRPLLGLAPVGAALRVLEAATTSARFGRGRVPVSRLVALAKSPLLGIRPTSRASGADEQASLPFSGDVRSLSPDLLENVAAYVGRELALSDWLRRARRLGATLDRSAGDQEAARLLSSSNFERRSLGLGSDPGSALRESAESLEWLGRLVAAIPSDGDAQTIADALRTSLADLGLGRNVRKRLSESGDGRQFRHALVDLRGLDGLERSITAVADAARLSGNARTSVAAFRSDLERALAVETVRVSDGVAGGVRVLRPGDMRGLRLRAVFIVGLVDSEFPTRPSEDWIYPTSERLTLAAAGVGLESHIARDVLEREEHYCYQAASRATELLVLSRPLIDDDGSETNPSYFLDEIARALGYLSLPVHRSAGSEAEAAACSSTSRELARNAMRARATAAPPGAARGAFDTFARETGALTDTALALSAVELDRANGPFSAFDGRIGNVALRRVLADNFAAHTFSASEINDYGACPFQYLLRHVLRLRPRVEAALDLHASDLGVILHDVLQRAVSPLVDGSKTTRDLSRKELRAIAAEVLARFAHRAPPLDSALWQIDVERVTAELDAWIEDEAALQERLGTHATRPTHVEVAFGMPGATDDAASAADPLTLSRGEERIQLRGRIDRIDETASGDVVVYDYKLGTGPSPRDMDEGRDVQMAVYLAAVEALFLAPGKRLAGGGYYAVRRGEARNSHGMYREEFGEAVGAVGASRLDDASFAAARARGEGHVWRAFDRLRSGHFEVVPAEGEATCSRCDFRSVCRFDHTRVRHKLGAGGETD